MSGLRIGRLPIVVAAMALLLVGVWGGLLRIGWSWPDICASAVVWHGPLMIGGFLGTLIATERAVALGYLWSYTGPVLSASGALALLFSLPEPVGAVLITLASGVLVADFIVLVHRQPTLFSVTMGTGALLWLAGNTIWLSTGAIPLAVPWWIGFLVLTIVGERLELSRFLPRSRGKRAAFLLAGSLYLAGLVLGLRWPGLGWLCSGGGLIALALWLVRFDLARTTIRQAGLTRFVAVCLLSGYGWMVIAGLLAIVDMVLLPVAGGQLTAMLTYAPKAGFAYDGVLHAIFLGFVMSMIFGHAPIIFPAVLGVQVGYRERFYGHLVLLHLSVVLRVIADVASLGGLREWAGLLGAVAILAFMVNTVSAIHLRRAPSAGLQP